MSRTLPVLAALAAVLGTGLVHGLWTERWQRAPELEEAVARMDGLPGDLGPWQARPAAVDPEALAMAGAAGCWSRTYRHARGGPQVTVILLCGPAGRMAVHRPEHCYRGAGYEMVSAATRHSVGPGPGAPAAEFWSARFRREEGVRTVQLRIFWSWCAGGAWEAPDSPRWAYARLPFLYKLYVVRETDPDREPFPEDPSIALLRLLIPELTRALSRP
jgi:hypothetical protein